MLIKQRMWLIWFWIAFPIVKHFPQLSQAWREDGGWNANQARDELRGNAWNLTHSGGRYTDTPPFAHSPVRYPTFHRFRGGDRWSTYEKHHSVQDTPPQHAIYTRQNANCIYTIYCHVEWAQLSSGCGNWASKVINLPQAGRVVWFDWSWIFTFLPVSWTKIWDNPWKIQTFSFWGLTFCRGVMKDLVEYPIFEILCLLVNFEI